MRCSLHWLNTLLTVTKEAADRVLEATLRADKNAADTFNNVQADPDSLPPYNAEGQRDVEGQSKTRQESVKRSDTKQAYQNYPCLGL